MGGVSRGYKNIFNMTYSCHISLDIISEKNIFRRVSEWQNCMESKSGWKIRI